MKLKKNTYRTLSGTKEIVETIKKKSSQWVIYENNKPAFYVDFYDLKTESNLIMNNLVLCSEKSIHEVLELINKRNNINLSVPKISRLGFKKQIKSEEIELSLEPIPEKWLSYYIETI
ncbi:hypothetical protein [Polaribacter sargassicola]|uniref:hypothetical protein n=1 Tax=Polaribacter sargassicola TaxID=2836891 RepID=UPI001F1938C1|nr:hypothetical protein [Polaribacter sp. DS7-9]MCG1034989.1 hypothetical protein [Polaribacter sp. DS7-9]